MRDNAAATEVEEETEAGLREMVGPAALAVAVAARVEPAMVLLAVREGSEELGSAGCMRSSRIEYA